MRQTPFQLQRLLFPEGSKDSYFKAFGPKDHIMLGFWAILSLRVLVMRKQPSPRPRNTLVVSILFDRLSSKPHFLKLPYARSEGTNQALYTLDRAP